MRTDVRGVGAGADGLGHDAEGEVAGQRSDLRLHMCARVSVGYLFGPDTRMRSDRNARTPGGAPMLCSLLRFHSRREKVRDYAGAIGCRGRVVCRTTHMFKGVMLLQSRSRQVDIDTARFYTRQSQGNDSSIRLGPGRQHWSRA